MYEVKSIKANDKTQELIYVLSEKQSNQPIQEKEPKVIEYSLKLELFEKIISKLPELFNKSKDISASDFLVLLKMNVSKKLLSEIILVSSQERTMNSASSGPDLDISNEKDVLDRVQTYSSNFNRSGQSYTHYIKETRVKINAYSDIEKINEIFYKNFIKLHVKKIEQENFTIYSLSSNDISVYYNGISDKVELGSVNSNKLLNAYPLLNAIPCNLNFIKTGEINKEMEERIQSEVLNYWTNNGRGSYIFAKTLPIELEHVSKLVNEVNELKNKDDLIKYIKAKYPKLIIDSSYKMKDIKKSFFSFFLKKEANLIEKNFKNIIPYDFTEKAEELNKKIKEGCSKFQKKGLISKKNISKKSYASGH